MNIKFFKICLIVILMFSLSRDVIAQNREAYHFGSNVGDEISKVEAEKYGLFQGFSNFISAKFYQLLSGDYEIDIKYLTEGEIHEQVWYITRQEFTENYLEKLNSEYLIKSSPPFNPEEQVLNIKLEDNTSFRGKLIGIEDYSLQLLDRSNPNGPAVQIPVNKVAEVSVFRRQNPGKAIMIGLIPGAVVGLVGLLSGDDEPGFLSFSREDKALIGFMFGGFIGFNIGGTIAAMRSVDFDIPLDGQSQEEKLQTFTRIYHRNVPKRLFFRINPWFAFHAWKADRYDGTGKGIIGYMPGIRAKIYFTPRSGVEFSYGSTSSFSKNIKYYSYYYDPVSGNSIEKYENLYKEITYFSGGYFIALTRDQIINPVLSWGWGYYQEKNSDYYSGKNESLALHFKLGLEQHINRWITLDVRLGPVTDFDRLYLVGEFGISLGKFF